MTNNKKIAIGLVCVIVGIFLIFGVLSVGTKRRVEKYNYGYCKECGRSYECHEHYEKGDGMWITVFECSNCGCKGWVESDAIH